MKERGKWGISAKDTVSLSCLGQLSLNSDVFDGVRSGVAVVEEQLFAFSNVSLRENADPMITIDADNLRSRVWVHRMICEADFVALE